MAESPTGASMRRREDRRFLTGTGRYIEDVMLEGEVRAAFVRSPHAHAEIVGIDTRAALAVPGVLGVFTGTDLAADDIGPLPVLVALKNRDRTRQAVPHHLPLPVDRARYVGDPVAIVVGRTAACAREGAERVEVDYAPLAAVVSLHAAIAKDAPAIWDEAPGNVCLDWQTGDPEATEAAFARAAHVTRLELGSNRITANSIETRGAIAQFDPGQRRYTLHVSSQGVHKLRTLLAREVLRVPEASLRVITPDVGGGFGMKIFLYAEYAAVLWAAKRLGRPVKWIAERAESIVSDTHARDHVSHGELALCDNGEFLALRVSTLANLGAYLSTYGAYVPTVAGTGMLTGLYTLPAVHCETRCVFTNTTPLDAYRGAGKPEANFVLERLVDCAARELGMSPAELRRRNLVREDAMPYRTALGYTFDSGAFESNLDAALAAAQWDHLPSRRKAARSRGLRRGVGISAYFENTAGYEEEQARIHVDAEGGFTVFIGTQSNGQGHETVFTQVLVCALGISPEKIRLVQGDSDVVTHGHGTGGSRSLIMGGAALIAAGERIAAKAKRIAAHLLEAAEADLSFSEGRFMVTGTDRSVGFDEIGEAAYRPASLPPGVEAGLEEMGIGMPCPPSFPNGFHLCEAEVDPETGWVRIVRYTVVDDFGRLRNPMIVAGQVHGGTGQGIGQALTEACVYDTDSGQLLSGSFMDYCMPRADDMPSFDVQFNVVPCTTNPLGTKGCGEAGTIAAPAAVVNAIVDALAEDGVRHVAMPATPERVWRTIQAAR